MRPTFPVFRVVSPIDGQCRFEQPISSPTQIEATLGASERARADWRRTNIEERVSIIEDFGRRMMANQSEFARALCLQMGRPITQCPGEIAGAVDRTSKMALLAPDALADIRPPRIEGFERFVRREPLGTVLVLSPWNYPYLTAVNAVVPALLAGNTVLLKPSEQTPLVAEHFERCLREAGLPEGVFGTLQIDHATTASVIDDPRISHVCFTGSLEGGIAVSRAVAARAGRGEFIGLGLELGGKDPAYIRPDADLEQAAEGIVDGAFYNSGQSCCGVERVYVHRECADEFIERSRALLEAYRLGNPLENDTNLGPVVRQRSADHIRAQVSEALRMGARQVLPVTHHPSDDGSSVYIAPQLLTGVTHDMSLMRDETFGPVAGILVVDDDEQAIRMMNHSSMGLTASIWTRDLAAAQIMGEQLETGTVFMNRCDYLDPMLAWTGHKSSGSGTTLSRIGYEHLTRAKSFHFRTTRRS